MLSINNSNIPNKTIIQIGSHVGNTINDPIFEMADENTNLMPRKNKNEIISNNKLIIQVGAFNNSDNANKLLNKLTGFKAFIKEEFIKNNLFYRVRIGPFNNIDNAKNVLRKLLLKGFNTSKILYSYENN